MTAVVTAGVEGNATCRRRAGDLARDARPACEKVPAYAGTINTMLLVNRPLTPAALARAVVTMTEGKSAALQRLAVPSKLSRRPGDRHRHRSVLHRRAARRARGR